MRRPHVDVCKYCGLWDGQHASNCHTKVCHLVNPEVVNISFDSELAELRRRVEGIEKQLDNYAKPVID